MNKDITYTEIVSKLYFISEFMRNEKYEGFSDGSKTPKEEIASIIGSIYPIYIRYNDNFVYIKNKTRIIYDIDLDYSCNEGNQLIDYSEWNCITLNLSEFNSNILLIDEMELILRYGKISTKWINYSYKYILCIYDRFTNILEERKNV